MNAHSTKFGLIAGIGTVLILLTAYFIDKRLQLSPGVVWSTSIFYIVGMAMAAIEERKDKGGFISFKEALKAAFIVWMVANAIYHAFNYFHFNYFDPEMLQIQKDYVLETLEMGVFSEEMVEQMAEKTEEIKYDILTTIRGYIMSLVFGFILAAIIARLVRRDNFEKV